MSRNKSRSLQWGSANRPRTSNKLGIPNRNEGSDGDMQIRQTNYGSKLFGKVGGRWVNTFLSTDTDVFAIKNNKGQKTISLNSDGTASFGSSIDVGSHLSITGHIGMLSFNASGSASSSNISIGNIDYRPLNDLDDEADNDDNIAIGDYCISEADNATDNIAIGNGCMRYQGKDDGSTTAALCGGNIAIGVNTLQGLDADTYTRAWDNVAIGLNAMQLSSRYEASSPDTGSSDITECKENVAIGKKAGYRTSGSKNTFIGMNSGLGGGTGTGAGSGTIGYGNVSIGFDCFTAYTTGSYNTIFGFNSADTITSGNYNIIIGYEGDCAATYDKQTAIGYQVVCDTTNQVRIGTGTYYVELSTAGSGQNWAPTSDVRVKKNIIDSDLGLDFINALRPIKFVGKNPYDWPEEFNVNKSDPREEDPVKVIDGFIAQDVKSVMDDMNVTFSAWNEGNDTRQTLQYATFVAPLTKAIQELSAKVDTMQEEINNLKAE